MSRNENVLRALPFSRIYTPGSTMFSVHLVSALSDKERSFIWAASFRWVSPRGSCFVYFTWFYYTRLEEKNFFDIGDFSILILRADSIQQGGRIWFKYFHWLLLYSLSDSSFFYIRFQKFILIFSFENNRNFKSFAIDSIVSPLWIIDLFQKLSKSFRRKGKRRK